MQAALTLPKRRARLNAPFFTFPFTTAEA